MLQKIKSLHLEITDRCQAACPQCPRTNLTNGKQYEWIKNIDLTLDDVKTIFPDLVIKDIKKIVVGGNFGDPVISKHFIPIIEYFFSCNSNLMIRVSTNGSFYNEEWWKKLAEKFSKFNFKVVFAIEGIDQITHSFYRRGTDYEKVFNNARSFINAGGNAKAFCLVYEHNENTIDEIKEKNESINLETSFLSTERFWKENYLNFNYKNKSYVLKKTNLDLKNNDEIEGALNYNASISCFSKNDNHIYVDCNGFVSPCCFLGAYLYITNSKKFHISNSNFGIYKEDVEEMIQIYKNYDLEMFNAKKHTINEILNSSFYKDLEILHYKKMPKKCLRTCGNTPFKKI